MNVYEKSMAITEISQILFGYILLIFGTRLSHLFSSVLVAHLVQRFSHHIFSQTHPQEEGCRIWQIRIGRAQIPHFRQAVQ